MTDLRQAAQQALEQSDAGIPVSGEWVGCGECDRVFRCHVGKAKCIRLPVEQQAEPSQWRDMMVVSLVREGIGKHKARELADHFAAQQQAEPVAREGFNDWWNGDYDDSKNSYEPDSAAYWAWAGWQAAKRPWVGLTKVQRDDFADAYGSYEAVCAIEAKLKERNT
jgi:hypothetical protein